MRHAMGGYSPRNLYLGMALYKAYESELTAIERISQAVPREINWLVFKSAKVWPEGRGWKVRVG